MHALWRPRLHGAEQLPASGPVLLAANHTGFLDGPLVFSLLPRSSHFLVKQEMFSGPLGAFLRGIGQIPIDRDRGDRHALGAAVAVLARGGVVGVFPEGTRGSGDIESVQSGICWLALRTGAPVVPVAVLGTAARPGGSLPALRSRVEVVLGAPFTLSEAAYLPGRVALTRATEQLRLMMIDHVAQARRRLDPVSTTGSAA